MSRTDVWISRDEMVDFFEYAVSSEIKTLNGILDHDDKLTRSLGSNAPKDVVNKAIENSHRLVRDTRVGVDLLEDCQIPTKSTRVQKRRSKNERTLVDVRAVGFLSGQAE